METTLHRDTYGALKPSCSTSETDRAVFAATEKLLAAAAKKRLIPPQADTISFDRKGRADGTATHHEIYDLSSRPARVLVCIRETEGTRYGVKTLSKTYFIVSQGKSGVVVAPVSKAIAAKAAKSCGSTLGRAIRIVTGAENSRSRRRTRRPGSSFSAVRTRGISPFGMIPPGKSGKPGRRKRSPTTRADSFYRDLPTALAAARENRVFASDMAHRRLAVVRVRAAGRVIGYGAGKYAATRITPLEDIGSTL